jgi:16S rRNA (cytidine1402-2'-O)-methyltransferase
MKHEEERKVAEAEETDAGILSVVATPIGNLEDMTLRAVRILKEADYILCEDTRVTGKITAHYEIETPLRRYDAHASERAHERVIADLEAGKRIALVSDAGTPGVSDPGVLLVSRARAAGARVEAVPGASAVTAAFSVAGISGNQFCFLGFAPQKKGRETFFREVASELTKLHEEVISGTAAELLAYFAEYPDHVRGEFVVMVGR